MTAGFWLPLESTARCGQGSLRLKGAEDTMAFIPLSCWANYPFFLRFQVGEGGWIVISRKGRIESGETEGESRAAVPYEPSGRGRKGGFNIVKKNCKDGIYKKRKEGRVKGQGKIEGEKRKLNIAVRDLSICLRIGWNTNSTYGRGNAAL